MIPCELIEFQAELGTRCAPRSVELDDAQSFVAFEKIKELLSTVNGNYYRNSMNIALRFLLKIV